MGLKDMADTEVGMKGMAGINVYIEHTVRPQWKLEVGLPI